MTIIWNKSEQYLIIGKGIIQAGWVIEVSDDEGKALVKAGWTETKKKTTHEFNADVQEYVKIEKIDK